jgi:hypothetical protein
MLIYKSMYSYYYLIFEVLLFLNMWKDWLRDAWKFNVKIEKYINKKIHNLYCTLKRVLNIAP